MPASQLWAASSVGYVYTLSTEESQWRKVVNQARFVPGFKRVAAVPSCAWAVGCDHQVFLYVHSSDVPIRWQEVTYENERWVPTQGWSSRHLLPIDPWVWSNESHTRYMAQSDFHLPSGNWQWENDWVVDENVQGYITDKGGWQYSSIDFYHKFTHQKRFNSCVRRRRWLRYRRYVATDKWARIPGIHVDPLEEPVVDIAVGGQDIPNQPQGTLSVWMVTINGKLFFRTDVNRLCPEGRDWKDMSVGIEEVLGISVGAAGLVWAVTWSGEAIVRTEVSWQNILGTAWTKVECPEGSDRLVQVSVGCNAVWATAADGQVWFRKGINSANIGHDQTAATGTGWLSMVRRMKMITVGAHDQVWGIDQESFQMYFRTGVTPAEPSGKTWRLMDLRSQPKQAGVQSTLGSSITSGLSDTCSFDDTTSLDLQISQPMESLQISDQSAKMELSLHSASSLSSNDMPLARERTSWSVNSGSSENASHVSITSLIDSIQEMSGNFSAVNQSGGRMGTMADNDTTDAILDFVSDYQEESMASESADLARTKLTDSTETSKRANADVDRTSGTTTEIFGNKFSLSVRFSKSKETEDDDKSKSEGLQLSESTDNSQLLPSSSSQLSLGAESMAESVSTETDSMIENIWNINVEDDLRWVWVSGLSCSLSDEANVAHWFRSESSERSTRCHYLRQISGSSWRPTILSLLKERNARECEPFGHYESAVEQKTWTKKGHLRWWRDLHRNHKWIDSQVELLQDQDLGIREGTFSIQYSYRGTQKCLQLQLDDIKCVNFMSDPNHLPMFVINTTQRMSKEPPEPPIKMAASSEQEMEDWVAALSVACCRQQQAEGKPSLQSAWALTDRGDTFVHRLPPSQVCSYMAYQRFWRQVGGHMSRVESNCTGVTWGIGYDGTAYIFTGGYGGAFFKGMASSTTNILSLADVQVVGIYENQRWNPVMGYADRGLPTDQYMWSDETGKYECTKENTKLHSRHCHWVSDWQIDYGLPGGVDKMGWQYAKNFHKPFEGQKRLRSYVRRRKWIRKFKLVTSGPWKEVGPLPLRDISLQTDLTPHSPGVMAVWAIGTNGDVLCRLGVTKYNTQGVAWHHVSTDQPFTSISIGSHFRVWATAKDGSAWLRNGVTSMNPLGQCWFHVPPPNSSALLQQISAGDSLVMAVDCNRRLWVRKDVTVTYPEGTAWQQVHNNVRQVSINCLDQVWCIVDNLPGTAGRMDRVLCRRVAIPKSNPRLGSWDMSLQGCWQYVSARGSSQESAG